MNLRWLWLDFIDPSLPLDRQQRRAIQNRARAMKRNEFTWGLNVRDLAELFLPLGVAVAMLGVARIVVPRGWISVSPCIGLVASVALATWLVHAWLGRWLWRPWVLAALRAEGYEVCCHCGYWLRGLGDDVKYCPECGAKREPMPPNTQVQP